MKVAYFPYYGWYFVSGIFAVSYDIDCAIKLKLTSFRLTDAPKK